jgi:glycosyltransferase involved in cell wall biosynthesis
MGRNSEPLISIVLTTYNSEKVLEQTLKGIIEQDFLLTVFLKLGMMG